MTTPDATFSRRQALLTGGFGVAAAAFLAACGSDTVQPGKSGAPAVTTSTPPTVPPLEPNSVALELDQTVLRTASSMELVVFDVYRIYGARVQDPTWLALAATYQADHEAAAEAFVDATDPANRVDEPNEVFQAVNVAPIASLLTDDVAILDYLQSVESTLAATYITGAGTLTNPERRSLIMGYGATSARRSALLGNGGSGLVPVEPLYPLDDLIPNDAYLTVTPAEGEAPADGESSDADTEEPEAGDPGS